MKRLGRICIAFMTAMVMLLVFRPETAKAATNDILVNVQYGQTEARGMLALVNELRTGSNAWYWNEDNSTKKICTGLSGLTYDYGLEQVAMKRAAEIAVSYSHTRPNGDSCFTAYTECGVSGFMLGENIAAGYTSASDVFVGWAEENYYWNGQGHRRNMLNSDFKTIGIGHVYFNGVHYWVQEFGTNVTGSSSAANDSNSLVNVSVADSMINDVSVSYVSGAKSVSVGESVDIPKYALSLNVSGYWSWYSSYFNVENACSFTSADGEYISLSGGKITGLKAGTGKLYGKAYGKDFTAVIQVVGAAPTVAPKPTAVPTATPKPTAVPTATPKPTAVPTATPKPTAVPTVAPKPTAVPTATPKPTAVPTATPKPTAVPTATPKPTTVPGVVPAELKAGCKFLYENAFYRVLIDNIAEVELVSLRDAKATSFTVPSTVSYRGYSYNVTRVKENAFKGNTTIKSVTMGKYIEEIGSKAFYGCKKLKSITIKSKYIGYIGNKAFSKISKSAKYTLPSSKSAAYKRMIENSK